MGAVSAQLYPGRCTASQILVMFHACTSKNDFEGIVSLELSLSETEGLSRVREVLFLWHSRVFHITVQHKR